MDYQIQRQQQSKIIQGADGKLYRITPVDEPIEPIDLVDESEMERRRRQAQRMHRERINRQRAEQGRSFVLMVFGGCFVVLCLAIFASATKPVVPPAPVTNPKCWMFCS